MSMTYSVSLAWIYSATLATILDLQCTSGNHIYVDLLCTSGNHIYVHLWEPSWMTPKWESIPKNVALFVLCTPQKCFSHMRVKFFLLNRFLQYFTRNVVVIEPGS